MKPRWPGASMHETAASKGHRQRGRKQLEANSLLDFIQISHLDQAL